MGIETALLTSLAVGSASSAYTAHRARRAEKLEKKRTDETIARMEREKEAEEQAEEKRKLDFMESSRERNFERRRRTQRTFAGMQQDFNPAIMKQKLGQ